MIFSMNRRRFLWIGAGDSQGSTWIINTLKALEKIQFLVNWDHLEETDLPLENTNSGQFTLGTYDWEVTSGSYIFWSSYSGKMKCKAQPRFSAVTPINLYNFLVATKVIISSEDSTSSIHPWWNNLLKIINIISCLLRKECK